VREGGSGRARVGEAGSAARMRGIFRL
jgi:hypothetical protein